MADWIVWGKVELGRVTARDKDGALREAEQLYPHFTGLQSVASYRVQQEEAAIARARLARRAAESDGVAGS